MPKNEKIIFTQNDIKDIIKENQKFKRRLFKSKCRT